MYLSNPQNRRRLSVDIEGDSLTPTRLWCLCWENIDSDERGDCIGHDQIRQFYNETRGALYVGHNFLKFDAPHSNRLVGSRIGVGDVLDTLVYSTVYSPSILGGHSLEAWIKRLNPHGVEQKIQHEDWSQFSSNMLERCRSDAKWTKRLFLRIVQVLKKIGFSEKTLEIQHKMTAILEKQRKNGFYFDQPRAVGFYNLLRDREQELEDAIREAFPERRVLVRDEAKIFTKTGDYSAIYQRDLQRYDIERLQQSELYRAYERVQFNIGSSKQRAEKLVALGWEPDEFTPTGQPKVTEKSLVKFAETSGVPEVALITKWMAINGRANMINTWLDNWNNETSCIHGQLFVADTLRFRHQKPNTANIPAVRTYGKDHPQAGHPILAEAGYYTYEARDLWCARPGRMLVGTDASGLELRMLAHYLGNAEFTEQVVNGSPHDYNASVLGVDKPKAKTFIYAFLYGAGDAKIGKIVGGSKLDGERLKQTFRQGVAGLDDVLNDCADEFKRGRISLVDGAWVVCPSSHAALNYKLQGGGARLMAQGSIFLEGHIKRSGLSSLKVGDIHDEWQYDVEPGDSEEHGKLAIQSLREAGEELNLRVPITGESKIGRTWAETH